MEAENPHARVYGLLARAADKVVLLRRGPSKQVLCLTWDLKTDVIVDGQWFKGRIYERRCDLNPSGTLLAYFAATNKGPIGSWTAISRPPWLSATAFFGKGDSWGGGGLFDDDFSFQINHSEPPPPATHYPKKSKKRGKKIPRYMREVRRPAWQENAIAGDRCPTWLSVKTLQPYAGRGEDDPILAQRLERDGWIFSQTDPSHVSDYGENRDMSWSISPPILRSKKIGKSNRQIQVSLHGIGERNGRWYVETMQIVEPNRAVVDFGRIDWCDVDHAGNVLYSEAGLLYRLKAGDLGADDPFSKSTQIADLNPLQFRSRIAPSGALSKPQSGP